MEGAEIDVDPSEEEQEEYEWEEVPEANFNPDDFLPSAYLKVKVEEEEIKQLEDFEDEGKPKFAFAEEVDVITAKLSDVKLVSP